MAGLLRDVPLADAVVQAWPLACGGAVAAKTIAVDFAHGILRVEVPDVQWKVQLQDYAAQYVAALNACVGRPVKRVTFVLPGEIEEQARRAAFEVTLEANRNEKL